MLTMVLWLHLVLVGELLVLLESNALLYIMVRGGGETYNRLRFLLSKMLEVLLLRVFLLLMRVLGHI